MRDLQDRIGKLGSVSVVAPVDSLANILSGRPVDLLADTSPWVMATVVGDAEVDLIRMWSPLLDAYRRGDRTAAVEVQIAGRPHPVQYTADEVNRASHAETVAAPPSICPDNRYHGNPFRYCQCGWVEPDYAG
jgi:hypothetical protein